MSGFKRELLTPDDEAAVRKHLLEQRLTALEAEHLQAQFGVEQIEKSIVAARAELAGEES